MMNNPTDFHSYCLAYSSRVSRQTFAVRHWRLRSGFTLVELVVSMLSASVLLAGLCSALIIANRASDDSLTQSDEIVEVCGTLRAMVNDLQFAIAVTELTSQAITVQVPDRDSDNGPETIRYAWSGNAGDPLTRAYNGGTATTSVQAVHALTLLPYSDNGLRYITIRIQATSDKESTAETDIPLVNRP